VYLQNALAAAEASGGTVTEIRVAHGTYKPDRGANVAPGDRTASFKLENGVVLRGGFAGCGAVNPHDQEIALNPTVLSGDLFGDDGAEFSNRGDNSFHVVVIAASAAIYAQGLRVEGGNAIGSADPSRGGEFSASKETLFGRIVRLLQTSPNRVAAFIQDGIQFSQIANS